LGLFGLLVAVEVGLPVMRGTRCSLEAISFFILPKLPVLMSRRGTPLYCLLVIGSFPGVS
jgi:hypothetical protein